MEEKNELCKDNMGFITACNRNYFCFKTKEVYISLLIGIVSGTLLLTNFHLVESLNLLFDTVVNCLSKPSNIGILIFLVMLGIIVTLMTKSGGSQAYGKWAKRR